MRKSLNEESDGSTSPVVKGAGEISSGVAGSRETKNPVEVPKIASEERVGRVGVGSDGPPAPKGSSITLDGSGDHSGRDGWNSMSLADFYKVMLYEDHGRKL